MTKSTEIICSANDLTNSNTRLTGKVDKTWREKSKSALKQIKGILRETTVEPCLFIYMMCISLSALAVQNMHLEKSCRVNYDFGDDICDRIANRNTTGLEDELKKVQSSVANVVAWKYPLQTLIPALSVIFVGAWSDRTRRRKICILLPLVGEIVSNIGLLLATYYFKELSLSVTAVIETLPSALSGSYIFIYMGVYSFLTDKTSVENRTFRLGIINICVNIGSPTGTILSGILLEALGYYGMFSLLLVLHSVALLYGLLKLEDVLPEGNIEKSQVAAAENKFIKIIREIVGLAVNTILVAFKPRAYNGRRLIISVLILYVIMVGPLFGDSQVAYLFAILKFNFTSVEYSIYGTINIVFGLFGTAFCIYVLSKRYQVQDSIIGIIAGVSRIAACFVFAFAPSRIWFYSAPAFNIFSQTGLTAVRSMATKSVPIDEVAKLSSLIGVMEGIASSIYNPISSSIYNTTIDNFPGAFYMFDAALTVIAIFIFSYTYVMIKNRKKDETASAQPISSSIVVARYNSDNKFGTSNPSYQ